MPESWQWTEADILDLITNGIQESIYLDYKACDALEKTDRKKSEMSKDISAFANSAGGTIVYGVTEDRATHLPQAIDIGYDPANISKEWIEQVVNSNIQRRIDGIRINTVTLDATHPGRVLYVVSIPQSSRAPHMAADHRFYKRYNFESIAMEEYEIRDVAQRNEVPELRLAISFYTGTTPSVTLVSPDGCSATFLDGTRRMVLQTLLFNDAPKPADYTIIRLFIDERLNPRDSPGEYRLGTTQWVVNGQQTRGVVLQHNWSQRPVWSGLAVRLGVRQFTAPAQDNTYFIGWRLDAPSMTIKKGGYLVRVHGDNALLEMIEVQDVPVPDYVV